MGSSGEEQPITCMPECGKFRRAMYYTRNAHRICRPTLYSENFKNECPLAQINASDATYSGTCPDSLNYVITFCPNTTK
ncbi:PR5-like receptor kinase [Cardamine amara subsp. amara]|uniref:PR5-like receptor kinase n=1 Tax=Cardamine amara subsp. amara TaxID=228776 RepID=A0ABD1BYK8_CARAN